MDIVFMCLQQGKRLYSVSRQGEQLFAGTRDECERYLEIHNRKILDERENDLRIPRPRPYRPRAYRVGKMHA